MLEGEVSGGMAPQGTWKEGRLKGAPKGRPRERQKGVQGGAKRALMGALKGRQNDHGMVCGRRKFSICTFPPVAVCVLFLL